MSQIPRRPREEIEICHYPKHNGKRWEEVIEEDYDYVRWLVSGDGPPMDDGQYNYIMILLEYSNDPN